MPQPREQRVRRDTMQPQSQPVQYEYESETAEPPRRNTTQQQALPLAQREPTTTKPRVPTPVEYDDNVGTNKPPYSARRYTQPQQTRAISGVQPASVPARRSATYALQPIQQSRPTRRPVHHYHWSSVVGVVLVLFTLGALVAVIAPPFITKFNDDRVYGNPRTFQCDHNVGHGGVSHFTSQNLSGKIMVTEVSPGAVKVYLITTLIGTNAALYPATLDFSGTGKNTMMIVTVNSTAYMYDNTGKDFSPHK